MYRTRSHKRGFTLIELLAVIAIIGILAAVVMSNTGTAKSKSRDGRRLADIKSIQLALELYYTDVGNFPLNLINLVPNYLPKLPTDPSATSECINAGNGPPACYKYAAYRVGSGPCSDKSVIVKYHLGALMESTKADNSSLFTQDHDFDRVGYVWCTGTDSNEFNGLTFDSDGYGAGSDQACLGTSNPTQQDQDSDSCFDVTN